MRLLGALAVAGAIVAGGVVVSAMSEHDAANSTRTAVVTRVIDGDTVEIASGEHVRLIGVDTPERGTCGFGRATRAMRQMVEGREVVLVNPGSVQDFDAYERLLRFVEVGGKDAGFSQIRAGRGAARYDSRDGYDPHPRESRYRQAAQANEDLCDR